MTLGESEAAGGSTRRSPFRGRFRPQQQAAARFDSGDEATSCASVIIAPVGLWGTVMLT